MTEVIIPIETKKFYISCKHSDQIPKVTMIDNKISMSSDTKDDIKDDITDKKKKKYVYDKTIVHDYNQTYFNKHKDIEIKCDICTQTYKFYSKFNHKNTKLHKMAIQLRQNINNNN